jgi:hypothetical protein
MKQPRNEGPGIKGPTRKVITDESQHVARLQPDYYVKLRQMAMSEEFQLGLNQAVENVKSRYQISSETQHLAAQAMVSHVAINDLIEEIYDVFVNPPYISPPPVGSSDFASDDGEDLI